MWILDGSPELKIENNDVITCTPDNTRDNVYSALWHNPSTPPINSGDQFWTIKFTNVERCAWVGLTNEERHKKGYAGKGLYYGGNLSDGGRLLIQNYGPRISANDVIGMLVSISDEALKVYFYHNGSPLGLAFQVDPSTLPDPRPVVRFSSSRGSAVILKGDLPPDSQNVMAVKKEDGVEGSWKIVSNTIKLNGKVMPGLHFDPNGVTLNIIKSGENNYFVQLKIINQISFHVETTVTSGQCQGWKCTRGPSSTKVGSSRENLEFENQVTQFCLSPEGLKVNDYELTIWSQDCKIIFERQVNFSNCFNGNPF